MSIVSLVALFVPLSWATDDVQREPCITEYYRDGELSERITYTFDETQLVEAMHVLRDSRKRRVFEYDHRGALLEMTTDLGADGIVEEVETTIYDGRGRVERVRHRDMVSGWVTDTTYFYGTEGNVVRETVDVHGDRRLEGIIDYTVVSGQRVAEVETDGRGNVERRVEREFGTRGVTEKRIYEGQSAVPRHVKTYEYASSGLLVRMRVQSPNSPSQETVYAYQDGQLISEVTIAEPPTVPSHQRTVHDYSCWDEE